MDRTQEEKPQNRFPLLKTVVIVVVVWIAISIGKSFLHDAQMKYNPVYRTSRQLSQAPDTMIDSLQNKAGVKHDSYKGLMFSIVTLPLYFLLYIVTLPFRGISNLFQGLGTWLVVGGVKQVYGLFE
jgi:hypothetical protein